MSLFSAVQATATAGSWGTTAATASSWGTTATTAGSWGATGATAGSWGITGAATGVAGAASSWASTLKSVGEAAAPLAGAALTIAGANKTGQEDEAQRLATAQILEYNRAVMEKEALAAEAAGELEEEKLQRQKKLTLATQRANFGASGFTMQGTPLAIMADTVAEYEKDIYTNNWNAGITAQRYRSQGNIYGMSASAQRRAAGNSSSTALLTGITSASTRYLSSYLGGRA